MDTSLRCNSLKCRTHLNERAVVTTCSHIFCVSCSESLRLVTASGQRVCPACQTILSNPDDAVATTLNPTEDYKTSVLSGLDPTTIMECASRGLAFWSYQTTQEIVYQEYLGRGLTERNSTLNEQIDRVIHDANAEISKLQIKTEEFQIDQQKLQQRNHELVEAYRDKSRKCSQAQELYDKLKRRTMLAQIKSAASNSIGLNTQKSTQEAHYNSTITNQNFLNNDFNAQRKSQQQYPIYSVEEETSFQQQRAGSHGSGSGGGRRAAFNHDTEQQMQWNENNARDLSIAGTPSQHRQRLPLLNENKQGQYQPQNSGNQSFSPANVMPQLPSTNRRRPLGALGVNNTNIAGLGVSTVNSGTKFGQSSSTNVGPRSFRPQGASIFDLSR